jgi:hypothetical protein
MKAKQTLLLLGCLAVWPVMASAQPSTNATINVSTNVNLSQTRLRPVYPVVQYKLEDGKKKPVKDQDKIMRYEGLSSLAWTTIALRQSESDFSAFPDAREHEPKFYLFSLGHEPW